MGDVCSADYQRSAGPHNGWTEAGAEHPGHVVRHERRRSGKVRQDIASIVPRRWTERAERVREETSMNGTDHYGALIIGDGQAGGPLSTDLVKAGYTTVVVEREHAGGTCVNEGCTPTKTMVASARVAYLARRGHEYGVEDGAVTVDMTTVRGRKRRIVSSFRDGSRMAVERGGAEFLKGEARFVGPKEVAVSLAEGGARHLTGDVIFINTGGRPSVPPVPGLDSVPFLNSTSIMELDAVPKHLLVMGGGYVGLEFAQMFLRFGSR